MSEIKRLEKLAWEAANQSKTHPTAYWAKECIHLIHTIERQAVEIKRLRGMVADPAPNKTKES